MHNALIWLEHNLRKSTCTDNVLVFEGVEHIACQCIPNFSERKRYNQQPIPKNGTITPQVIMWKLNLHAIHVNNPVQFGHSIFPFRQLAPSGKSIQSIYCPNSSPNHPFKELITCLLVALISRNLLESYLLLDSSYQRPNSEIDNNEQM